MLKSGTRYVEADLNCIHALERQKLLRRHARRLQQLGAESEIIEQIADKLLAEAAAPQSEPSPPLQPIPAQTLSDTMAANEAAAKRRRGCPATSSTKSSGPACRGRLGFRARSMRNEYSIFKDPPG